MVQAMEMASVVEAVDADAPIEDVALAIALDEYPELDASRYLEILDVWADQCRVAVEAGRDLPAKILAINRLVYDELGFRGNAEDYYDPRNSFLSDVVERRRGIPISLAVVLMALGRRLDVPIEGVGFPGHFLVRAGGEGGFFLDPFNRGQVLERDHLLELAKGVTGSPTLAEGQLLPVDTRVMAIRMLFNLQQIYERRAASAKALVVCDRLCDLTDAPFHRRDRGRHALALGAHAAARDDFLFYLSEARDAPDRELVQEWLEQAEGADAPLLN
ncbi:MAG: transglutaminase-like domain-containing protein [Polyangiaceae bacterium]